MKRQVLQAGDMARSTALHVCGARGISAQGWKVIARRVWDEISRDRVGLLAAGVTFYMILALFPAMSAVVSVYGLLADPVTIGEQVLALDGILPGAAISLIRAQLDVLINTATGHLSLNFAVSLLVALWSMNAGVKSLLESLNVVYGETERRGFVRLNLVGFGFTLGAIVMAMVYMIAIAVVPIVLAVFGFDGWAQALIKLMRWPVLLGMSCVAISLLGRYGLSREHREFQWLSVGSLFTVVAWMLCSALFSFYLSNFANYDKTYGSLGAAVGVMVWVWLSTFILLLGAEINAEIERYRKERG